MALARSILRGFLWNHAGKLTEYALVYIFSLIVARRLGAELTGVYAMLLSVAQLLLVISSFGLEMSIASRLPGLLKDNSIGEVRAAVRKVVLARAVAVGVIGLLFVAVRDYLITLLGAPPAFVDVLLLLLFYVAFRSFVSLFTSLHYAHLETRKPAFIALVMRCGEVLGALVVLGLGFGLREIILLIVLTGLFHATALAASLGNLLWGPVSRSNQWSLLSMGGKFWANTMMEFLLGKQTTVLLMSYFLVATASIGYYDVAMNLAGVINFGMTIGFSGMSIASLSSVHATNERLMPQYWEFLSRAVAVMVIPAFIFAAYFAGEIVVLLYMEDFLPSTVLFQVLVVFYIGTRMLAGGIAADYLHSQGMSARLITASLTGAAANIGLGIFLIPRLGVLGAVYATGVAALLVASLHAYYSWKLLRIELPLVPALSLTAISLMSASIARWLGGVILIDNLLALLALYLGVLAMLSSIVKPLREQDVDFIEGLPTFVRTIVRLFTRVSLDRGLNVLTDRQKWALAWMETCGVAVDIGSSSSALCHVLGRKAKLAIALDTDGDALRSLLADEPSIHSVQAKAERLPFPTASVDTVLLLDVLEHVSDEPKVIAEVHRILRPGGSLILSVPNKGIFRFLDPQNLSAHLKGTLSPQTHHRHYSEADLTRLLFLRFRVLKKHYGGLFLYPITFAAAHFVKKHFGLDWSRFFKALGDWDNDISWGRWSYNVILVAEKI